MNILLTGATGYIGRRLLPLLIKEGHSITCLVRDPRRFDYEDFSKEELGNVQVVAADLFQPDSLKDLPQEIDIAFYLVHSMGTSYTDFSDLEAQSAQNFTEYIQRTSAQQVIYLGGIANDKELSKHLNSRKNVESILQASGVPLTVLRAGIIIGSGSASYEMIRDLTEKLPVMIAPRWVSSRCQPIAIRNVLQYLLGVMLKEECYDRVFDIGGSEILTYEEMLLGYARQRGLKRYIIKVPVLTPRLSSYWLLLVTSTTFSLARSLVDSLKNEVVCQEHGIREILPIELLTYQESLERTLTRIAQRQVLSSWTDSIADSMDQDFLDNIQVPEYAVHRNETRIHFKDPVQVILDNIWCIGGDRGWYYASFLWKIRGMIDKLVGGVGLRRGRRSPVDLKVGDSLDFWRVLVADRSKLRLLLFAEMKLPGEAWLEFRIVPKSDGAELIQTATFRPLGLWGRVYWFMLTPFHFFIFKGMARNIVGYRAIKTQSSNEEVSVQLN